MPAQSNDALQFQFFSLSAYEDDGKWIKNKVVITKDRLMVEKRLGYCILRERERERERMGLMNCMIMEVVGFEEVGVGGESFQRDASIGTSDVGDQVQYNDGAYYS
jgi:hypothetical protein